MEYRRRLSSDVWHFCSNCSNWPRRTYQMREEKASRFKRPTTGELCDQCLSKTRREVCK